MILVRDIFQLKFGKAKDAKALWKQGAALEKKYGNAPSRLLTDLTGPYYTFIMESSYPSLSDYGKAMKDMMGAKEWSKWYKKFVPLIESGKREIFTIEE